MIRRTGRLGPAVLAGLLIGGSGGCGGAGVSTFVPGVEGLPAPGYYHAVGEPGTAERTMSVRIVGSDGNPSSVSNDFAIGDLVVIDGAAFAGEYSLIVDQDICAGMFGVEVDRETDLTLQVTAAGCSTIVTGIHPAGDGSHEEVFGIVSGMAPIGAVVTVLSLDDPPRIEPRTMQTDESGVFQVDRLPAGRYRLDVTLDGVTVGNAILDLEAGQDEHLDFGSSSPRPASPSPSPSLSPTPSG